MRQAVEPGHRAVLPRAAATSTWTAGSPANTSSPAKRPTRKTPN